MQFGSESLNNGIDFHRGNLLDAVSKRGRGIGASSGAENKRMLKLRVWEELINPAIERLLRLPWDHALVPDAVNVQLVAARLRGRDRDFVIRRPIAVKLEKERDCRRHNERQRPCQSRAPFA